MVFCFGLISDFTGEMFEGTKKIIELADSIREVPCMCSKCDKKAQYNFRLCTNNEKIFFANSVILVDNNIDSNTTNITTNTSSDYNICLELQESIDKFKVYLWMDSKEKRSCIESNLISWKKSTMLPKQLII